MINRVTKTKKDNNSNLISLAKALKLSNIISLGDYLLTGTNDISCSHYVDPIMPIYRDLEDFKIGDYLSIGEDNEFYYLYGKIDFVGAVEKDFKSYENIMVHFANYHIQSLIRSYSRFLYKSELKKLSNFISEDLLCFRFRTNGEYVWINGLFGFKDCFWRWDKIITNQPLKRKIPKK